MSFKKTHLGPSKKPRPELLQTLPAAALDAESIPYLELPGGSYRIPQGALIASLRGNFDLAGELRELDERNVELTDEQVQAAVADKQL